MNILYLHTHDLGRYVGPYGYPPRMPNLQRLAEQGVLYRNAFCAAPTCAPSRAALLTGTYPHQCGMFGLTNQGWTLNDPSQHLAAFLARQGYETILAGVEHVAPGNDAAANQAMGYTRVLAEKKPLTTDDREPATEAAIAFLKDPPDRPFFLDVGYGTTHHSQWDRSFVVSQPILGDLDWRYVRALPHLPDTPATRWEAAMQYRAAEYFDIQLGRVLDALDASGQADKTLVIFTTDHGPGVPGVKMNLNDRGTGVAMVLRGPGFAGGKVSEALVSHLDLYPTICQLLNLTPPPYLQGQSLLGDGPREAVFSEQNYHGRLRPLRSLRTERYRYVRRIGPAYHLLEYACDGGEAAAYLEDHGMTEVMMPEEQLFDLALDPNESINVIAEPRYAPVLADLRARLDEWTKRTGDGPIPKSPGAPAWASAAFQNKTSAQDYWQQRREALQGTKGYRSR